MDSPPGEFLKAYPPDVGLPPAIQIDDQMSGLTGDFNSDDLDEPKLPASVREFGLIESTHMEVRGICKACSEAGKIRTNKNTKRR